MHRPTYALVNLYNYQKNLQAIQRKIGKGRQIIAIIKADAYGHGIIECARAGWQIGIRWFGVATVDEALSLRQIEEFSDARILILGPTFPSDAEELVRQRIDVAVGSLAVLRALDRAAKKSGTTARVHLKIDTGMGRFGFWFEDVPSLIDEFKKRRHIEWIALMTHFSESDVPSFSYTKWQIKNFNWLVAECEKKGFRPQHLHAANSGAVLQHPSAYYDLVRPGIMTYGLLPDIRTRRTVALKPVLTLLTRIIDVREFPPGRYISYGRTYQTRHRIRAGLLPLGYGDGYPRHLSNSGYVMVCGKKAPIIGRVCMDQVLIDITQIPTARVGSEVVVYGKKGKNYVPIEEVATRIGTISYELTTQLTRRVPRIYIGH